MHDLAMLRHINRPRRKHEATLATYLDQQLNHKPVDTRIMLTDARIARCDALQRWLARDWITYHRTYFLQGRNLD